MSEVTQLGYVSMKNAHVRSHVAGAVTLGNQFMISKHLCNY